MSLDVRVAPATAEQVDDAGALTAEAYLADRLLTPDDTYEDELRDARRRAQEATLLVATVPGHGADVVVGTITLAPAGSSYAEVAHVGEVELRMLAVAPEARRHGVATQLVLGALREAVAAQAGGVVLSTLAQMRTAQRLYARLGFVPLPQRDWSHEDVALHVHRWRAPEAPGALVESATWPPLRRQTVDGWQVGLSGGLTRRANSVLPWAAPADLEAAVHQVEAVYAAEGLISTFRLGREARPAELALILGARGYHEASTTDVLVRDLAGLPPAPPGPTLRVADEPDEAWLAAWTGPKGGTVALARRLLSGSRAHYLTAVAEGRTVGILRVAREQGWAALSCLAVTPDARRAGVARALTLEGLAAAARHGATKAFLQVEAQNDAAWRLYCQLGFRPADRYRYAERAPAGRG